MFYNWEFILKAREEDQKPTGVVVGDYELIIRVVKGQVPIPPYIDVCNSFDGVSDEEVLSAKLTLVENVFLGYALFLVVGRVGQEKAYRDLCHKLKPIANDYAMRLEAVGKRRVGRSYSWDLWSGAKGTSRLGDELLRLDVVDNVEFVLRLNDNSYAWDGKVRCSAVVPVHPTKLRPSLPTVVKRFYETMRWPESNPRYLEASELLLDEIDRLEKAYEVLSNIKGLTPDQFQQQLFYNTKRDEPMSNTDTSSNQKPTMTWSISIGRYIPPTTSYSTYVGVVFLGWCLQIHLTRGRPDVKVRVDPDFKLTPEQISELEKSNIATSLELGVIKLAASDNFLPEQSSTNSELLDLLCSAEKQHIERSDLSDQLRKQLKRRWVVSSVSPKTLAHKNQVLRHELSPTTDIIVECTDAGEEGPGFEFCFINHVRTGDLVGGEPGIVEHSIKMIDTNDSNPQYIVHYNNLLRALISMEPHETTKVSEIQTNVEVGGRNYSYLIVFQDLIVSQATPLGCDWVGSFEVKHLYNVAVYRAPSESFGLMFVLDSNVKHDAVRAGAQGVGLAAKLSKLAVTQDYHTYPVWSAITEQLRACFE